MSDISILTILHPPVNIGNPAIRRRFFQKTRGYSLITALPPKPSRFACWGTLPTNKRCPINFLQYPHSSSRSFLVKTVDIYSYLCYNKFIVRPTMGVTMKTTIS